MLMSVFSIIVGTLIMISVTSLKTDTNDWYQLSFQLLVHLTQLYQYAAL